MYVVCVYMFVCMYVWHESKRQIGERRGLVPVGAGQGVEGEGVRV